MLLAYFSELFKGFTSNTCLFFTEMTVTHLRKEANMKQQFPQCVTIPWLVLHRGPVRGVPIIPYTYNDEVIYTLYLKLQTHLYLKSLC